MKRPRLLVLVAATAVAVSTGVGSAALAAPPSPDRSVGYHNDARGIVPSKAASRTAGSGGNLAYHTGGQVMTTNTTYAIYWNPNTTLYTESGAYRSTINGFLSNVAADSGKTSNVYYSDTQYYQNIGGTQHIAYSSTFGGGLDDTQPYPASGCTDITQTTVCLTDAQIQQEVSRFVSAKGLPTGINVLYFVFTPKGVGSCLDSTHCAFSYYCAYHSHIGSGSSLILYANQPYTETVDADCGSGAAPNDKDADSTINVASHEHNEAITDALGNAWYDRRGSENGDKCAWNFGTANGSGYNQTINGAHYYLQQEWSNARSGCVLTGT